MLAYKFDKETKEFKGTQTAQIDPKTSQYLLPANSTFTAPPTAQEGKTRCFIDDEWVQLTDHRKQPQVNLTTLEITDVDYLGEAHQGYQFISEEVKQRYLEDTDRYKVIDGVFTDISDTEEYREIKRQKEAERVANLTCTKRVLVLMLQQLQYSWKDTIRPLIYADDDAALEWELCVELQRKNPLLDQIGGQLGISSEQIDQLFKYANDEVESLEVE